MTSTYDTSTYDTSTYNAQTHSRGCFSRAPPRRHQCRFQFSLCAAAALGLVLLAGHPSHYLCQSSSYGSGVNALPVTGRSLIATTSATIGDTSLRAVLEPRQQPHQRQKQQILALHTSNSVTFSAAPASATVSGLGGRFRLALPKHASFDTDAADVNSGYSHITLETADVPSTTGSFADSGRVLASGLISESHPHSPQDITTSNVPKRDDQHLAFLDLMTRVSGKSRDQAETEIWKERKVTQAAVRKELEMRMQLQRQGEDYVTEGDGRIELKQVKSKAREEDHHHKEKAMEKGKGKHGKKGKQKNKAPVKATSSGGNGGGVKTTPTIFYVPHQDDDALAMALAIREHIEAGRKVIVHLYSDGINALLRDIVSGTAPCTLQHPPHKMDLMLHDVVTGRTHEFRQSLRALGVRDEDIYETGWSDIEPLKDYSEFQEKLRDLILGYERKYPGASHKCISGEYDRDSVGRNPTHRACWDVATQLLQEFPQGLPASRQLWDFRFYRTYTYYNPPSHRSAQFIRALPQFLPYKQKALDQYKRWDPSKGELAWGYHSVKALIDAAYYDPHVYLDMLDNDPTNPENLRRGKMGGSGVKGEGKYEVGGGEDVEEGEEKHGMFPAVWRSSRKKNTNKMLLEEDEQQQQQARNQEQEMDMDDGLIGLHRKVPGAHLGSSSSSASVVPHLETNKDKAVEWDEKEADMRLQVLKAFDDAAQRPEGKEYHDGIRAMASSGI
ncbi:hypothetical protein EC957_002921 [Mortierella hygrophila]|uniref:N-acetylglucosaminylphosphatidylinositol deacetylase n=1 Tax=Mortierella hygrophila TaxID=979708 RepID=A0A9P6F3K0_9FUNG|nr:hypothetical protein EC957_002921 [Mortierella hygrophila]